MDEFEKAKAFIVNKNNSLSEASRQIGIPLPTLSSYRQNPEKLKTAAWFRVHILAGLLDKLQRN